MQIITPPSSYGLTLATAVASTSGTAVDFTGIPSTVKRITVMFNGVSINNLGKIQIQLGSGSIDATGYISSSGVLVDTPSQGAVASTTGFLITGTGVEAAGLYSGSVIFSLMGSNIWVMQSCLGAILASRTFFSAGSKTLSGTLDRLRVTTNGTDLFDAGSVNIMYE
jgi:hypothetical protein